MTSKIMFPIRLIRESPNSYVSHECALALRPFIVGFSSQDATSAEMFRDLALCFPGPSAADACTRAYLLYRNSKESFLRVLSAIEGLLGGKYKNLQPLAVGPIVDSMEYMREPVRAGRSGLVLGEFTMTWIGNFVSGYITGVGQFDERIARMQRNQLSAFEMWLKDEYGWTTDPSMPPMRAPWYGILRVFEGEGCSPLRFLQIWDDFLRAASTSS